MYPEAKQRVLAEHIMHFYATTERTTGMGGYERFPTGWRWYMHPGTWNRIRADVSCFRLVTYDQAPGPMASREDLMGLPVVIQPEMPLGMLELRYSDQTMIPMG